MRRSMPGLLELDSSVPFHITSDFVRANRLAIVLEAFEPSPRPVHLIYDRQNRLPLKMRAFIDFIVPRVRERLVQVTL